MKMMKQSGAWERQPNVLNGDEFSILTTTTGRT